MIILMKYHSSWEYVGFTTLDLNPVSTRRRFDVETTLVGRQKRCYNVETTSCVYWEEACTCRTVNK